MTAQHQILPTMPKVGCWWSDKKNKKLRIDDFIQVCLQSGFDLKKIDLDQPLEEQGPFVAIVHKLSDVIVKADFGDARSQAICAAFEEYSNNHPDVVVLDPIPNVAKILDRYRQYKIVEDSSLQKQGDVFVPAFVELTTANVRENIAKMKAASVTFPCVCKPSLAHGSGLAHQMSLIFNEDGLNDITLPCVAQTFINHNAILYKLFIIGSKYFIIERPSLKNFCAGAYKTIFFDSHDISKPHSASILNELDASEPKTPTIYPKKEKLDQIVHVLCQYTQLSLYGIDVIIDNKTGRYAIIDINIFPGYDGIENFFQILIDFIISKIPLQANNLFSVPKLAADAKWIPASEVSACKKSMSDPSSDCAQQTVAVIPNSCRCFCCPISGQCHNMTKSIKETPRDTLKTLNLSAELSGLFQNANLRNEERIGGVSMCNEVFGSPDSAQDDSGIETSDSCDEKKKGAILKNVKRQHSRCHQATVTVEESPFNYCD